MPTLNGVFTRIWRFIDQKAVGDAIMRSEIDIALDDLAAGINEALSDASQAPPTRRILSGSGTYVRPENCILFVEGFAGSGGGGGSDGQGAGTRGIGGGGGGGGYFSKLISDPAESYAYTAGLGGAGGPAGNNDGSRGGDTTFSDGASLNLVAEGGGGGGGATASASLETARGGDGGNASGGDINLSGQDGTTTRAEDGSAVIVGNGGDSHIGPGAIGPVFQKDGVDSTSGGGGSGAACANETTNRPGGNGHDGMIVVTEHYL